MPMATTLLERARITLWAGLFVIGLTAGKTVWAQSSTLNITLTGQSMIRSDFRTNTPTAAAAISPLLKGDVIFTIFEGTVAEKGETVTEGRGFLAPPQALDALQALGFNLVALSDNHSFDLKVTGIQNTLREVKSRTLAHAGIGNTVEEAV